MTAIPEVDESILRRAFTEALPEPKELPPLITGVFRQQHWSPPKLAERAKGAAMAALDHVKRLAS